MTRLRQDIVDRLDELESRLAFQEDLIESLNETVVRQDRDIARLQLKVKTLAEKLEDLGEAAAMPGAAPGHEVPPHY